MKDSEAIARMIEIFMGIATSEISALKAFLLSEALFSQLTDEQLQLLADVDRALTE